MRGCDRTRARTGICNGTKRAKEERLFDGTPAEICVAPDRSGTTAATGRSVLVPSPSSPAALEPQDQTVYQALAVTTGTFDDLPQMALAILTGNPIVDVQIEQEMRLGGIAGELIVADVVRDGQKVAGVAAAFTLGRQGVGYIVLAIFPPGEWADEQSDFLKVVGSFRPGVPPGMRAFPLAGGAA